MKYLSTTENFSVSNIILGCMRISSLSTVSLEKLVDTALSQGITLFDHADIYGGEHLCEKRFGEILKQTPSLRSKMLIQTKCGITKCGYDFSREHILKQVNDSLAALETDYVDILLLHRPDTLLDPCEVAEAFSILKKNGKVRHFGVSNFSPMQTEFLQKSLDEKLFTNQIQLSLAHSLIFDEGISFNSALPSASVCSSSCLEYSRLNNILLQAWSPLGFGNFEGTFLGNMQKFAPLNELLETLAQKYDVQPVAIAFAWLVRHPAGIAAVCGTTNPEHLTSICRANDVALTRREWYSLYKAAGHIIP